MSAEEIDREDEARTISDKQRSRLFMIAHKRGWSDAQIQAVLRDQFGVRKTTDILRSEYEEIVGVFEHPPAPAVPTDPEQPF